MGKFKQFLKDTSGAVFVIIALVFVSMVGITATAVDFARGSLLKSELVSSLDAAGLAGGTVANSTNMEAMVNKYFNVNLPNGYMGATVDPLQIELAADKTTLTISGSAHMNNSLMQVVDWDMTNIQSSTEVTIERKGMELVLVLDNTGSMSSSAGGGVTKIEALKTASRDLVDILYGTNETMDNFWMGLVPFSQAVNIGTSHAAWTAADTYDWGTTSWGGCVEAREAIDRDVTDDLPATALFPKYYAACDDDTSNQWFGTNSSRNNCNTGTGIRYKSLSTSLGPNKYCPKPITQMVADKTTILNGIDAMQEAGNTMINLGLVWGWRMLSPQWRGQWGGEMDTANLPLNYNTPLMNKVVVLLTDGDNQFGSGNYTAYGELSDNRMGTTNSGTAQSKLNTRTLQVCSSMKANNILIYTIALGTGISNSSKNLLRSCASKPEYFFESPTGSDLRNTFKTIGDSLSNLRISK